MPATARTTSVTRRLLGLGLSTALSAVMIAAPPVPAAAAPMASAPKVASDRVVQGHDVAPGPSRPTPRSAKPFTAAAPVWPAATTSTIVLPAAPAAPAATSVPGAPVPAGTSPISVASTAASRTASTGGPSPSAVQVRVYDHADTARAGIKGLLFTVARADGVPDVAPVEVGVDYATFKGAYGADWSSRLRLVELTGCVTTTPVPTGCTAIAVPSSNDLAAGRLTAVVPVTGVVAAPRSAVGAALPAAQAAGVILAATSGPSGGSGSFSATPLMPSSSWSAGSSAGDFQWSYPLSMPPGLGGPAPSVTLAYDSAAVDGEQATTNNQPSWIGEGFSYEPGYIERSYIGCAQDMGGTANNTTATGDLCWATNNATLSMPGHGGGELLQDSSDTNRWHMRGDDGTYIRHLTGAGNGAQNGEYWRVTTPDGTQYFFGSAPSANSTLTEPVYGNNPGEPCHAATFAASSCTQAYRWDLDEILDPSGNTTTFHYAIETNSYAADDNTGALVSYDRASHLTEIDYGMRTGSTGSAPERVVFSTGDRCITASCSTHDATNWPDTPWDQQCTSTPCYTTSPTFWSTVMLNSINTQLFSGSGSGYVTVNTWTLTHKFPDPGDGTRAGLWLASIQQTGSDSGTAASLPAITFNSVQMANRVEPSASLAPMNWLRLAQVVTETGSEIEVTYSPAQCVSGSVMPDPKNLQNNVYRCYPVTWTQSGQTSPTTEFFNKYVVEQVDVADLTTPANPTVTTSYQYIGNPAWHFTDDNGLVVPSAKTWSVWRGYGDVKTAVGTGGDSSTTETTYFQGMNGDHLPSGTRSVQLPAVDLNGDGNTTDSGDAPAANDDDALAGMKRSTSLWNGTALVSRTVEDYWESAPTATRTVSGITVDAVLTGTADTHTETVLDGGRAPRTASTHTVFDPASGLATQVQDNGDDAVSGDETCTLTSYDQNAAADGSTWLLDYPSRVQQYGTTCSVAQGGGLSAAQVIADTLTYYDGATATTTPPTRGLATRVDSLKNWVNGAPSYLTSLQSQYDSNGRVTSATDVRGNTMTTTYSTNAGGQQSGSTVTNALGWISTITTDPATGHALTTTDPNGRITAQAYDGLGRLTKVWLPGRDQATQSASTIYSYTVRDNAPNVVATSTLIASGGYTTSYAMYDGMLRPRQTQAPRGDGQAGALITDTLYDTAGRPSIANSPYLASVTPSTSLFVANQSSDVPRYMVTTYDGAGRTAATAVYINTTGTPQLYSTTTTTHGGDRVDTAPPPGSTATSTVTDARGDVTALLQYHGGAPTPFVAGSYDQTTYTYNARKQLVQTTDPAGNRWSSTYDVRGRIVQTTDPNRGPGSTTYDDAGDITSTTDARGVTLSYTYDQLGRKTGVYQGPVTAANQLSGWTYDGLTNSRGQLTATTTYDQGNAYRTSILGFTANYQPTAVSYTIPAAETGLAGTYTYAYSYNVDGSPSTTRIPSLDGGALPTETITDGYNGLGQQSSLSTSLPTATSLIPSITYTGYGEIAQVSLQTNGGNAAYLTRTYTAGTRTLGEQLVSRQVSPTTVSDTKYTYDQSGNPLSADEAVAGDNQCFQYDNLDRLVSAWTPSSGDCTAVKSVAALGSPAPYWLDWSFDATGDRTSQISHDAAGGVATTTYSTPAAGSAQPHALTSSSTADSTGTHVLAYGYDPAGDTTRRSDGSGGTQTLGWSALDHLASVSDGGQAESYVCDVGGTRLVERDTAGKTLYLPGQELRYSATAGTKSSTRYYGAAGQTLATRTSAAITWLFSDAHGTMSTAIDAAKQTAVTRYLDPYGNLRGAGSGGLPSSLDRGFIGGLQDPSGLIGIGVRAYDPVTGRFVSTDPLVNAGDPQSLSSYAYAAGNPVSRSDPSGKRFVADTGGGGGSADPFTNNPALANQDLSGLYVYITGNSTQPKPSWRPGDPNKDDHEFLVDSEGNIEVLQPGEPGFRGLSTWATPEAALYNAKGNPYVYRISVADLEKLGFEPYVDSGEGEPAGHITFYMDEQGVNAQKFAAEMATVDENGQSKTGLIQGGKVTSVTQKTLDRPNYDPDQADAAAKDFRQKFDQDELQAEEQVVQQEEQQAEIQAMEQEIDQEIAQEIADSEATALLQEEIMEEEDGEDP